MINTQNYLNHLLPKELSVAEINGDRIKASNGQIFYNFYNDILRWLCGYNNLDLNALISNQISILKDNPDEIFSLFNQTEKILTGPLNRNYKYVYFTHKNVYASLKDSLSFKDKKYFLVLNKNITVPQEYKHSFLIFEKLLNNDKKDDLTEEGWSMSEIKRVLKENKKLLSGIIISPLLLDKGMFLTKETCNYIFEIAQKYHLPILWDESLSFFYRSGEFYLLNYYKQQPDFLTVNTALTENQRLNFFVPLKKNQRKYLKEFKTVKTESLASSIIILNSLNYFIINEGILSHLKNTSYRLDRKLSALIANSKSNLSFNNYGLIYFLREEDTSILTKLHAFLFKQKLLIFSNRNNALFLLPQLNISVRAVDLLVQDINDFIKKFQASQPETEK